MRLDTGLIIEVWNKGMLWDSLLGLNWLPLQKIHHSNQVSIMFVKKNTFCLTSSSYDDLYNPFLFSTKQQQIVQFCHNKMRYNNFQNDPLKAISLPHYY